MSKNSEAQKARKLEYQNFDLEKVKKTKDGLKVSYFEKGVSKNHYDIQTEGQPHPAFDEALEAFKQYTAQSLELLGGWDHARENLRDNDEALRDAIAGNDREINRIQITGVSYLGDVDTAGCKITASLKCGANWVGIATPKIAFKGTKLGYEQTVEKLCEALRVEVYAYLFQNKRAQQDLLDQAEEIDENNLFVGNGEPA